MNTGGLHIGSQETCKNYLRTLNGFYVYILRRPDNRPFYIGKGFGDRALAHKNEARHPNDWRSNAYKLNVIRSITRAGSSIIYEIDSHFENELSAYVREAELISYFKRLHEGGTLTNLAPGGGSSSGASPASKEKHSATLSGIPDNNPERATLNGFVLSIYPELEKKLRSIPIKPLSQHNPKPTQCYPKKTMNASVRQAVALIASAAANSIPMDNACQIPRLITIEGVRGVIESGVACDILTSGMGSILTAQSPKDEVFSLTKEQSQRAVELVGLTKCINLGVSQLSRNYSMTATAK